ncbi:hypothetical protein K435DRAFT_419345 [Dendrothele bispora CBS 962.96]|uniref:Uncharacterized protein n=1 Tax=Dendrothele bispora (strain CBS 962.96) TaxID=1314807 RepID=A0A4S8MEU5_DENBC|nr:hypothetical protein K435DRAFT_419345 [Dendrothele bispora CBS 962.96]
MVTGGEHVMVTWSRELSTDPSDWVLAFAPEGQESNLFPEISVPNAGSKGGTLSVTIPSDQSIASLNRFELLAYTDRGNPSFFFTATVVIGALKTTEPSITKTVISTPSLTPKINGPASSSSTKSDSAPGASITKNDSQEASSSNPPESSIPLTSGVHNPTASNKGKLHFHAGAIAGSTVGGVVVVLMIIFCIYGRRRRRRSAVHPISEIHRDITVRSQPKSKDPRVLKLSILTTVVNMDPGKVTTPFRCSLSARTFPTIDDDDDAKKTPSFAHHYYLDQQSYARDTLSALASTATASMYTGHRQSSEISHASVEPINADPRASHEVVGTND